jgi:hypothetical protein
MRVSLLSRYGGLDFDSSAAALLIGVITLACKPSIFNPLIRTGKSLFNNFTCGKFGLFSPQIDYSPVPLEEISMEGQPHGFMRH